MAIDLFRSLNSSMLYIQNSVVTTIAIIIIIITCKDVLVKSYPMAYNFFKLLIELYLQNIYIYIYTHIKTISLLIVSSSTAPSLRAKENSTLGLGTYYT